MLENPWSLTAKCYLCIETATEEEDIMLVEVWARPSGEVQVYRGWARFNYHL